MKSLSKLSTEQILKNYELPHRFYALYASQVAKHAIITYVKTKDIDSRSLKAIEIAERFGNGEHFTQEFLKDTASAASAAAASASAASAAAYAAAYAAASAASSAASAAAAYAASAAAYAAARKTAEQYNKELLLKMINDRFSRLQKLIIFGEE